jgi:uncharacterized protein YneF (UPF0154 family)
MGNMASLGIVGLISLIAVAVVSIWVPLITACVLVFAVLILIVFVIRSMQRTLKDNPAAALEDQLYLEYRKMEMELAAKDRSTTIEIVKTIADPKHPSSTLPAVIDEAEEE